jgi:hypothetical protein
MVSMEKFKCSVSEKYQRKSKPASDDFANSMGNFVTTNHEFEQNYTDLTCKLNDCCYDVTMLSLLQPQLLNKRKKLSEEISLESVLLFVKKHTKKKEVLEVIPLLWQIANHRAKFFKMKNIMLDNELQRCHQRLELHTTFVLEILNGLKKMLLEFETNSLTPLLLDPLSNLVDTYNLLQNEQTNENLTTFFKKFDLLVPNLERVVTLLKCSVKMENSSELQEMFRNEILCFTKECLAERNRNEQNAVGLQNENTENKGKLAEVLSKKDSKI